MIIFVFITRYRRLIRRSINQNYRFFVTFVLHTITYPLFNFVYLLLTSYLWRIYLIPQWHTVSRIRADKYVISRKKFTMTIKEKEYTTRRGIIIINNSEHFHWILWFSYSAWINDLWALLASPKVVLHREMTMRIVRKTDCASVGSIVSREI